MKKNPPKPVHVAGTLKGEETVHKKGREPGRGQSEESYRTARDSTSINPEGCEPIHPDMPRIPPA